MTSRHTPDHISELARQLTPVKRPNPLLWLYHWRYELVVLPLAAYGLVELGLALGVSRTVVALAAAVGWFGYVRPARRFLRGRLRAIVVQHRLRTAFAHAKICTLSGRPPSILWTRPRGDDILVSLLLPAGVGFDHIHPQRRLLAELCAADEVYVDRHPQYANLITLSICTVRAARTPARPPKPAVVLPLRAHS